MPYIQAKSATRDAWLYQVVPGAPKYGRFFVDGVDVYRAIEEGDVEQFDFPIGYKRYNGGKRIGDLVWTMSSAKVASPRFIETLRSANATGYKTFPLEFSGSAAPLFEGYVGFAVTSDDPSNDLWNERPWNSFGFHVNDRVYAVLLEAVVDGFEIVDPNPVFDPPNPPIDAL